MDRFFSAFPSRLPGLGLLVLRVAASVGLAVTASPWITEIGLTAVAWPATALAALLLSVGFLTPVVAVVTAVAGTLVAIHTGFADTSHDQVLSGGLLAAIGLGLVFLGPGSYSLDARLFGWRRINVAPTPFDTRS